MEAAGPGGGKLLTSRQPGSSEKGAERVLGQDREGRPAFFQVAPQAPISLIGTSHAQACLPTQIAIPQASHLLMCPHRHRHPQNGGE